MMTPPPYLAQKLTTIRWAVVVIIFIIFLRLLYLQVNLGSYFTARSEQNFLRTEIIYSPRGNILDRNGKLLATNRPVINLCWHGTGNHTLSEEQKKILTQVESILNIMIVSDSQIYSQITHAERRYKEIILACDISREQLCKLQELFPTDRNLIINSHFKRHYPYTNQASHIIGYLSGSFDVDSGGKMGLEKQFEHLLKGKHGSMLTTINSFGRKLKAKELQSTLAGDDIQTTIDIDLQKICEQIFPEEYTGTVILMDPATGDILSLVSRPTFDPNMFLTPMTKEQWSELQEKKPFLNRALNANYPPGSIFKLVTISAALEHNIISQDSHWYCNGNIEFAQRKYWCHQKQGHGKLNTSDGRAKSCNILCYEIAKRIDIDLLAEYAHKFGLGKKTNILLPEKTGLIPSRKWKIEAKGERWWPGETLSAAIGQSYMLVTPMQVARMISSIFTGNLPTPRILLSNEIEIEPLTITKQTRDFLKESMRLVVTTGTGRRASTKNFQIYAKTSTAQTSALTKRLLGKEYLEHAWFVCHLSYKNMPPLVVVILVENIGSSITSTMLAKDFLVAYKQHIDAKTTPPQAPENIVQAA